MDYLVIYGYINNIFKIIITFLYAFSLLFYITSFVIIILYTFVIVSLKEFNILLY